MYVQKGIVVRRKQLASQLWRLTVACGHHLRTALLYADVLPVPKEGDEVWLNTTAVDLQLGTGGVDFVLSVSGSLPDKYIGTKGRPDRSQGHIMKLRYTPFQLRVLSVEEEASPHHRTMKEAQGVDGLPVVVLSLHSQLAAAAAALRLSLGQNRRIVYVMTDDGALPIAFSRTLHLLRQAGYIDATVTAGDSFGGDLEAVNVYSALLAACHVAKADAVIVGPGPGIVGTATPFGTTALFVGQTVDAIGVLNGRAVVAPRISFSDRRPRHRGVSHHTLTALGRIAQRRCLVVLPPLAPAQAALVHTQLTDSGITCRHRVVIDVRGDEALARLEKDGFVLRSMGRGLKEERPLFLAAAGAGYVAADGVKGKGKAN